MKKVDFLMVMAYTASPTSDLADLILPIKHIYEYNFMMLSSYGSWLSTMPKLVDAPGECRDSFQIFHDIGELYTKLQEGISMFFVIVTLVTSKEQEIRIVNT